jgi:GNAT superfamily N-acetyltransferase
MIMNFRKLLTEWLAESRQLAEYEPYRPPGRPTPGSAKSSVPPTPDKSQLALFKYLNSGFARHAVLYVLYNPKAVMDWADDKETGYGWLHLTWGGDDRRNAYYRSGLIGVVAVYKRDSEEDCAGAWEVKGSGVLKPYKGKGYGKMLYGLVMADIHDDYLMADRDAVSTAAQGLWKGLEQNPKIEKFPPDDEPYMGEFDDHEATEPTDDDCEKVYPGKPELNKAYRYKPSAENKKLLSQMYANDKKCRTAIKKAKDKDNESAYDLLLHKMGWLFNFIYDERG